MTENFEELLTTEQVAKMLDLKPSTLCVWRSKNYFSNYKLPFIKVGRLVRYRMSDIENFINTRKVIELPKAENPKRLEKEVNKMEKR